MVKNTLLLDCGNTRIKARFADRDLFFSSVAEVGDWLGEGPVERIVFSDVAGRRDQLIRVAGENNLPVIAANVRDDTAGLKLAYKDVRRLGVDRWLTMLAGVDHCGDQAVVVVDAGTALKIDVISGQRRHLGGCIAPGLQLGNRSLAVNAEQLDAVSIRYQGGLGTDTDSCINYGLVMGAVALIEHTVLKFSPDATVLISGGDRDTLSEHLTVPHIKVDNLVLEGLGVYLRQCVLKDDA